MHEGHRERMRDKLFAHGEKLTDCEILEILLFDAISRKNTNPVAHLLLDSFGDLQSVFEATPRLLCTLAGIGPRTAEYIYLIGSIYRRISETPRNRIRLYSAYDVSEHVRNRFASLAEERLEMYFTDEDGFVLCTKIVAGEDCARVGISERQLDYLLKEIAPQGVLLVHNHPSGVLSPSAQDDESLRKVFRNCNTYGVAVRDCVICAGGEIYSYYLSGRLESFRTAQ